jgi:hypothetical protein
MQRFIMLKQMVAEEATVLYGVQFNSLHVIELRCGGKSRANVKERK